MAGSGLGTFTTAPLKADTWLGEFEGEIFDSNVDDLSTEYVWVVSRAGNYAMTEAPSDFTSNVFGIRLSMVSWGGKLSMTFCPGRNPYQIDGAHIERSNWMRWMNCARHTEEENVMWAYCYGKVLYRTMRDVAGGEELLIYYGDEYAEYLGIDPSGFQKHQQQPTATSSTGTVETCQQCQLCEGGGQ